MPNLISKIRFQFLGALFFAVFLPAFVRGNFTIAGLTHGNLPETITGMFFAVLIGYFFYIRLITFPGVKTDSYIFPVFTASYLFVVVIFFFFRFDYTRSSLAISFIAVIAWFYILAFLSRRTRSYTLAIVPGGDVETLVDIKGVDWVSLDQPEQTGRKLDGVVADLHADLSDKWVRFIADSALSGIPVFHVKEIRESLSGRVEIEHLSENTLGSLNPNRAYLEIKQTVDWICALAFLAIMSPVFLIIAVLIKIDSPGPVMFTQRRRGYRGEGFIVYKFRTMKVAADVGGEFSERVEKGEHHFREQAVTKSADPRITRVGKYLRRSRLDELPQLINILRGEMSWIGPRPEALVLSHWYESELPFYSYRHIVHPGITGWAQVNQGHVAEVGDVRDKLHYDFYYIKNFSFWLDFLIFLRTIRTVFTGFGAR